MRSDGQTALEWAKKDSTAHKIKQYILHTLCSEAKQHDWKNVAQSCCHHYWTRSDDKKDDIEASLLSIFASLSKKIESGQFENKDDKENSAIAFVSIFNIFCQTEPALDIHPYIEACKKNIEAIFQNDSLLNYLNLEQFLSLFKLYSFSHINYRKLSNTLPEHSKFILTLYAKLASGKILFSDIKSLEKILKTHKTQHSELHHLWLHALELKQNIQNSHTEDELLKSISLPRTQQNKLLNILAMSPQDKASSTSLNKHKRLKDYTNDDVYLLKKRTYYS